MFESTDKDTKQSRSFFQSDLASRTLNPKFEVSYLQPETQILPTLTPFSTCVKNNNDHHNHDHNKIKFNI